MEFNTEGLRGPRRGGAAGEGGRGAQEAAQPCRPLRKALRPTPASQPAGGVEWLEGFTAGGDRLWLASERGRSGELGDWVRGQTGEQET